jgi:hypothetical protein
MDRKSTVLLGVAIVAIGLFIIPSTMSMFVGQHSWYSVRTAEKQYDMCQRCHTAEVTEWEANTGAHAAYQDANPGIGCFCHQINESSLSEWGFNTSGIDSHGFEIFNETGGITDTASTWTWRNETTPHAAITIECVSCHHNATEQLNNSNSAHRQFFVAANETAGGNRNTACLACHTMVGLNITMERVWGGLDIYANHTNYTDTGWELTVTINQTGRTANSTWIPPNGTST